MVRPIETAALDVMALAVLGCGAVNGGGSSPETRELAEGVAIAQRVYPTQKTEIGFVGAVRSIKPLGRRRSEIRLVHVDPMFALTVRIESADKMGRMAFKPGTDEVFGIHSPTKLFAVPQESVVGRRYRFTLVWEPDTRAKRAFFRGLTATPVTHTPGGEVPN